MIEGVIDISHFNANPDFAAAKRAGVAAVIHKATQGVAFVDPAYESRIEPAREAGLLWGAYHFGTGDDPVAQADFFLSKASGARVLALDFESNPDGSSMSVEQAGAFAARIEAVTGRWPGIYGSDYLRESIGSAKDAVLSNCWLWIAEYAAEVVTPAGWKEWTLWQYTSAAEVGGIGVCDQSRFYGTAEQLADFWGGR